jgi:hypothetical protein
MTDEKPSRELITQQDKQADKSPKNGIGGRLKAALDDMVWNGTPWDKAAVKANLTVRSMRMSLQKPHVLQHLRKLRAALLAQSSAKTFHRLTELRDQDENRNAAVQAARTLETLADEQFNPRSANGGVLVNIEIKAGYVIDIAPEPGEIVTATAVGVRPQPRTIDHDPIEGDSPLFRPRR